MSSSSSAEHAAVRGARYDFGGRVAVVTGGSAGIGAAIAGLLQEQGAEVAVWDLQPPAATGQAHSQVDVGDADSIARACGHTVQRFGRIDMLVNNAGFAGPTLPLDAYDPQQWRRIVDINLIGTFEACRAVVPQMRRQAFGRIVNVASLAGKEGTPNASAYSAAKAGVLALTKSLGKELAQTGVLVNAVAPAAVRTELLAQMSPEHVAAMIAKSPMQRLGEPAEVAALVAWLCSESCSFSTGAVYDLSGGRATY